MPEGGFEDDPYMQSLKRPEARPPPPPGGRGGPPQKKSPEEIRRLNEEANARMVSI